MNVFKRLFSPVQRAVSLFFKHDVSLRRDEGNLRIVLEEPRAPGTKRPPTRAEVKQHKENQELALMLQQLAHLLDEMPGARNTMRHLLFVEQALTKKGQRALHKLPLDVLQKALAQLEGMVTNWSPVGLAALRSKMAVAIIDREHMDPDAEADAYRTAAVMEAMPSLPQEPPHEEQTTDDNQALMAAYAALGVVAPAEVQTQGELGSPSARAVAREKTRPIPASAHPGLEIRLLEVA
jgi:hypothetical protein